MSRDLPSQALWVRCTEVSSSSAEQEAHANGLAHSSEWRIGENADCPLDDAVGCELLSNEVSLMMARSFEHTLG